LALKTVGIKTGKRGVGRKLGSNRKWWEKPGMETKKWTGKNQNEKSPGRGNYKSVKGSIMEYLGQDLSLGLANRGGRWGKKKPTVDNEGTFNLRTKF